MERDAVGLEAEPMGVLEHVDGHRGLAAELARQRPFRADAVGEDAAKDARAGGGAGDLLDLGDAVDREQAHAERIGARDVAFLLDRVAEGDPVRLGAGREHHLDLGDRGGVEARAEPGEEREHLGRRVRLDRIEHLRVRQRLGEGQIVFSHDVEVDDQARAVVGPLTQELADARSHGALPHSSGGGEPPDDADRSSSPARDGDALANVGSRPACAALDWNGEIPFRTAGNDEQASSVAAPADGKPAETKKARSVVALSRVPR